jgi:hypothetical protein
MKGNRIESQRLKILEKLLSGYRLTVRQCRMWFGSDRASARILELRKMRFPINTKYVRRENKIIAQYSI